MVNFSIICGKDRLSLPICTLSKDGEKKASLFYPTFSLFALWWGDLDPHAYDIVDLILSSSLYLVVGWFWPSCLSHTWSSLSLFVLWWDDFDPHAYDILDPPFLSLCLWRGDFRVQLTFSFSLYLGVGWFWPTCLRHIHVIILRKNVINAIFYAYDIYT